MYNEIVCLGLAVLIVFRKMYIELETLLATYGPLFSKLDLFFSVLLAFKVKVGMGGAQNRRWVGGYTFIIFRSNNKASKLYPNVKMLFKLHNHCAVIFIKSLYHFPHTGI